MTTLTAHAYLVRGSEESVSLVLERLAEDGVLTKGNPDLFMATYESLSVDDARFITSFASLAPLGERKYLILTMAAATPEAQTALLKTVEEGTGRSQFFLIFPVGAYVLPTLASRCVGLRLAPSAQSLEPGRGFLSLSYADRLAAVEKLSKDKDREGARELVRSLLACAELRKSDFLNSAVQLRDLLDADRYLASSGSSVKAILGHLALTL